MSLKVLTLTLAAAAYASPFVALSQGTNDDPLEPCQPQGASGLNPPSVGSSLSTLYTDVLGSVKDIHWKKRSNVVVREDGFGCRKSLDCVNVQNLNIPMCYDKFTTNFAFADGSYGSLTTGEYTAGSASANLFTGDYSNGSDKGNIYANAPQDKPNTSTLSIPPQFTGTGVGGAVPASELGSIIVYTTIIPGTTFTAPTTVPATTKVATVSGQVVSSTVDAKTITGATTIAPETLTVTEAAPSSSSTGGAGNNAIDNTRSAGMSIIGAVLYVLYAL